MNAVHMKRYRCCVKDDKKELEIVLNTVQNYCLPLLAVTVFAHN